MPNRILRDWTDSFTIDELDSNTERFFVRLIMKVDDYGRFFSDARLLRANLFPLKTDIRDSDITRWLAACEKAGLIATYNVATKEYLQITNFKQTLRQKKEKHPAPPSCYSIATQTHSNSSHETKRNETETESREEGKVFHPPDLSKSNLFRQPNIPTRIEVHESFVKNGGTLEMANAFFERCEGTQWFYKGSAITNFTNFVASFVSNWKKNESKNVKKEINHEAAAAGQRLQEERARKILDA